MREKDHTTWGMKVKSIKVKEITWVSGKYEGMKEVKSVL